ncbi:hypothetical protein [Streptomyces sp. YIM 98790]|uniref:hypothetical protein n=1 Tax=Streptomyces sp. YIM 98790 TaxID=2689077 RepID=UPI0014097AA1|nr:hypothetical protein [Streptomyces sp. YIM 98790]
MSLMLDVSDDVRAELGDEEADRLLAGENAPRTYDCTSCQSPGDSSRQRTSTVLFVGDETAVLAFAHADCFPSQVVPVSEEQLKGAVRSITGGGAGAEGVPAAGDIPGADPRQAVLSVTCGQVLLGDDLYPAMVVEPSAPVVRPGAEGPGDDFLPLLIEHGFMPVMEMNKPPSEMPGWSVLVVNGRLHSVLQPGLVGGPTVSWWEAHQPLPVTDEWRAAARKHNSVLVYAAPAGSIGRQPREDLLRTALDGAASRGLLVGGSMPLSGT